MLKWSERSGTNEPRTHLTPLVFILSLHSFISHTTITLLWCVFHWIKTSGKNRSACLIQWNKTPHFINFRILEIHKFYNLQLFYWHFLEILWLFIFLVFYLFIFWSYIFTFRIYNYILGLLSGTLAYSCRFTLYFTSIFFLAFVHINFRRIFFHLIHIVGLFLISYTHHSFTFLYFRHIVSFTFYFRSYFYSFVFLFLRLHYILTRTPIFSLSFLFYSSSTLYFYLVPLHYLLFLIEWNRKKQIMKRNRMTSSSFCSYSFHYIFSLIFWVYSIFHSA